MWHKHLRYFLVVAILGNLTVLSEAWATFSSAPYFPLHSGNSWIYQVNGTSSSTSTVLPGTTNINGVETKALQDSSGFTQYFTNDGSGIRLHGQADSSTTVSFSPPIVIANAITDIGQNVSAVGTAATNLGSVPYTASFTVEAFDNVTVPFGNFDVVRVQGAIAFGSQAVVITIYVGRNIGIVKSIRIDPGGISTSELTAASQLVNCPTDSLQSAVNNSVPGVALLVSGTCNENILIDNNKIKVFLIGVGVFPTIHGGSYNPANPTNSSTRFGPETLDVRGKAILIQGLTITGGRNGILVHRSANAVITNNTVQGAAEAGIAVEEEAFAVITGNTVQSNGGDGIRISGNSSANIGFNNSWDTSPSPNIIQGNGGGGIHIEKSSHANIAGNLITNNNGDGVAVLRISHADIEGNEIHGNGGNGVLVSNNSEADFGNNNSPISFFNQSNTTTGTNAGAGIQCGESSVVRGHQGTLNGAGGAQNFSPSCVTTNLVNP